MKIKMTEKQYFKKLDKELPPVYQNESLSSKIERLRENLKGYQRANAKILNDSYALQDLATRCMNFQPRALAVCKKESFIFDGKGGKWEKLAFTFYTDLCEINNLCKGTLEKLFPVDEVKKCNIPMI